MAMLHAQAARRIDLGSRGGHTTVNARLHAALAATTFKSLPITKVALGADPEACVQHLISSMMMASSNEGSSSARLLDGMSCKTALRALRVSMRERLLCSEYLLGEVNPDIVIEYPD